MSYSNSDQFPEEFIHASDGANIHHCDELGDWWYLEGEDSSCHVESSWDDMVTLARSILSSRNTELVCPQFFHPEMSTGLRSVAHGITEVGELILQYSQLPICQAADNLYTEEEGQGVSAWVGARYLVDGIEYNSYQDAQLASEGLDTEVTSTPCVWVSYNR